MVPRITRAWLLASMISILAAADSLSLRPRKFEITAADRAWWSFQPLKPPLGATIDSILAGPLRERDIPVSPRATPRELVRRANFDLTGLPPEPETARAFEADPSETAWRTLIERLLASPHYGERWGRHWLDLVRYAESNGYERDGPKPNAWRYRDYVIDSFNNDKPYDRFIREQLAGDELPGLKGKEWRDAIIATGFYRLHVWDDEPDSTVAAEYDDFDDIISTTSTAFLALTMGCARCHDHKYDPISQRDYYSMLSFFRGIDPYGLHKTGGGGRGTGKIERALASDKELQQWETEKAERVRNLEAAAANATGDEKKSLETELRDARAARGNFDFALSVASVGTKVKPTHLLARGDPATPREEVTAAFPEIFANAGPNCGDNSAGRRAALANWIASTNHPLTARVMVNRIWRHHFGEGIVRTPDDFGRTGLRPSNQPLLDYLAERFIASGWSIKEMHRLIMTSHAYQMSSRPNNARGRELDESNELFWRQNPRRLEAESIRDSILAISGRLNRKQAGPSAFPTLVREVHVTQDSAGKGWTDSPAEEQERRSIYLVVKRALKIPLLECFDFANSSFASGTRPVTMTAPQALTLLNDEFVHRQAEAFAERLLRERGDPIERAFALALQRSPRPEESRRAEKLMREQSGDNVGDKAALQSFCRAMFNLNELIYVD